MYRFLLCIIMLFILGCSPANKKIYVPDLNSSAYPSYESDVFDTDEPIVLKTRPASASYKATLEESGTGKIFKHSIGSAQYSVTGHADLDWDIKYHNDIAHMNYTMKAKVKTQGEKFIANITCQSKVEIDGNIIEHSCKTDLDRYGFTKEEEQEIVDLWPYGTTVQLISSSKPLTTGDVFRMHYLEDIVGESIEIGIPEIVKGVTFYKGRKAIVTEFMLDDTFYDQEIKFNLKLKGYTLYDIESSILLSREESCYAIISIPGYRAYDALIYGKTKIDIADFSVQ